MLASILTDLLDTLESISTSPWFYAAIFSVAFLDSIVPIVPGETTVILGGIAAGQGELELLFVIVVGAVGAFLGDSASYAIGRGVGAPLRERWLSGQKWDDRLDVAEGQLAKRGGPLLVTARFIPGGRTAITLTSGLTRRPYRWFATWVAVATTIWATYAAGLGYIAGERFRDDHTTAFLVAFGLALSATALIEVVRWFRERRSHGPDAAGADDAG